MTLTHRPRLRLLPDRCAFVSLFIVCCICHRSRIFPTWWDLCPSPLSSDLVDPRCNRSGYLMIPWEYFYSFPVIFRPAFPFSSVWSIFAKLPLWQWYPSLILLARFPMLSASLSTLVLDRHHFDWSFFLLCAMMTPACPSWALFYSSHFSWVSFSVGHLPIPSIVHGLIVRDLVFACKGKDLLHRYYFLDNLLYIFFSKLSLCYSVTASTYSSSLGLFKWACLWQVFI